jgi:hypothetical protein
VQNLRRGHYELVIHVDPEASAPRGFAELVLAI